MHELAPTGRPGSHVSQGLVPHVRDGRCQLVPHDKVVLVRVVEQQGQRRHRGLQAGVAEGERYMEAWRLDAWREGRDEATRAQMRQGVSDSERGRFPCVEMAGDAPSERTPTRSAALSALDLMAGPSRSRSWPLYSTR